MKFLAITSALLLSATALAAINDRCAVNGTAGVCVSTADCTSGGGKSTAGYCPNDPADVRCCTKPKCGNDGSCKWTDQCTGTTVPNQCPGPANFKCCQSSGSGPGDGIPTIPTNRCKPHVVANGYIILHQFPGKIHTVWCYANKPGDHGTGTALDLMVQNRNPIGRTIAEWTMNNHARLKVKYIIWGQRIWNVQVDEKPRPWDEWRRMEDRGSDTQNHWDHNHVSFLPA